MLLIVAGWSFAEAVLFFIVADVPISVIAVRWGWRAGLKAALVAALAATAGGAATYGWSAGDSGSAQAAILALPAINEAMAATARDQLASEGGAGMLWGSISGVPYKLYALAAGSEGRPWLPFLLLSPLVRLPRFLGAALVASAISALLGPRIGLRARLAILGSVWTLFYAWYFWTMPG